MKGIVRGVVALAIAAALLAVAPATAGVAALEITFGDNFFSPKKPDSVSVDTSPDGREGVWLGPNTENPHNIRQDDRLFRSGPPSTSVDEYQTNISAGSYHYYCEVHGSLGGGMAGFIKVRPDASGGDGQSARITWADDDAQTGTRFTVQWRAKGKAKWKKWKDSTDKRSLRFGKGDSPTNAKSGKIYQVRALSFDEKETAKTSDFSPAVNFSVQEIQP